MRRNLADSNDISAVFVRLKSSTVLVASQLIDILDQDDLGTLALARDRSTRKPVMRTTAYSDPEGIPFRAIREASVLRSLRHPNVIRYCRLPPRHGHDVLALHGRMCACTPTNTSPRLLLCCCRVVDVMCAETQLCLVMEHVPTGLRYIREQPHDLGCGIYEPALMPAIKVLQCSSRLPAFRMLGTMSRKQNIRVLFVQRSG